MQDIAPLTYALQRVPGIRAIVLGGSRAKGTHGPNSDWDIGLYYEPGYPIDVETLRGVIADTGAISDGPITELGAWGPWINGGGWLTLNGVEIDILYRDLEPVRRVITDAQAGVFLMNYQVGHPHGFASAIWMGEIDVCQPLWDPHDLVAAEKARVRPYPAALRQTIVSRFGWEIGFAIDNAQLAARRAEQTHVIGCIYRALCCTAQVLFALNERYLINEKGALAEAAGFAIVPQGLAQNVSEIWRLAGTGKLDEALARLSDLQLRIGRLRAPTEVGE
jgi:predicted nucleotidyltransferase